MNTRLKSLLIALMSLSACFVSIPPGAPCATTSDCPQGQACVASVCVVGGSAGGSAAGGSVGGGSTAGGSAAGGVAGGSTAGGSTAGGSTAGGSTAGGSAAGGSAAGGDAGGSTAGGAAGGGDAGGSTAGGSTAGGSSAGGSAGGMVDTDRPVVVQTTPVTGSTSVSRATTIRFVFSEPMNTGTVLYLFNPSISFSSEVWSAGNTTLTLTPSASLQLSQAYSVAVAGQDLAGNAMMPAYSYSFTTEAAADTMAPTIVTTVPDDNAMNVPVNNGLLITFSEPMNPMSVQVALTPVASLTTATWANNNTELSIGPTTTFMASTMYGATITGADVAGNPLTAVTIRFTTAAPPDMTPPSLVSSTPANNATGVSLMTSLSLTFSETMNTGSVVVDTTPALPLGTATWSNMDKVATFPITMVGWPASTNVIVQVDGRDLAGNPMTTATVSFTTTAPPDATPPLVNSTSPATMSTNVPRTTNIEFNFSEPMNRVATEAAFSSVPAITCAFTWNTAGTLMVCNPNSDLTGSANYTVTLGVGARDLANNALAMSNVITFTTAAVPDTTRPTVASTLPAAGAVGVARSVITFPKGAEPTPISVTFSEGMSQASVQGAFSITSPSGFNGGTFSWNRNTMTYTPPAFFAYGQTVAFQIGTGAADLAGNSLAGAYTSSFRVKRRATANFTNSVSSLDGYLTSTASCTSVLVSSSTVAAAGDNASNQVYRGYLTFSIAPLASLQNVVISSATLNTSQTYCTGNVFTATFGSAIEAHHVNYGPSLDAADCLPTYLGGRRYTLSTTPVIGSASVLVTASVQDDFANRATRGDRSQFQIRTASIATDSDSLRDYCNQATASDGTPSLRPYLSITYDYD